MAERMDYDQEPRLVPAGSRWLALSLDGRPPRIGVFGATREEATERFRERLAVWKAWSEQALMVGRVVAEEDWPHGLRCMDCDRPLRGGDKYMERLAGFDTGAPVTEAVCLNCGGGSGA
jgi:hypothetical protein